MLVFAHGLEASPNGHKIQSLRAAGFDVIAPDFRHMALAERIALLDELTAGLDARRPVLGGSSYGGLVAAVVAARHPNRFCGLLLCAPALHLCEPPVNMPDTLSAPPDLPTVIIHGESDEVVPISASARYRQRSGPGVALHRVDDDHRLRLAHPLIIEAARELGA